MFSFDYCTDFLFFFFFKPKGTVELLKREAKLKEDQLRDAQAGQVDAEASNLLSSYKSEGDPNTYEKAYLSYRRFVESSLDIYKVNRSL